MIYTSHLLVPVLTYLPMIPQLVHLSHSIDTLVETLTTDLQNVLSWCNSNNMSLNVYKAKLMYISSKHKQQILAICDHVISICDSKIQVCSVERFLGVTIINTLC